MRNLSIILLVIIAVTIVSIAALIRPDQLGELTFWLNVGWILFLAVLNWGASVYLFFKIGEGKKSTSFGAIPSLNILVFIYSLLSVYLLVSSWSVNDFATHSNWHLIAQVSAFSITALICILIIISAKAADIHGAEELPSKEELMRHISDLRLQIPEAEKELINEFKSLHEIIRYSMPHPARLYSKENYQKLYSEVSEIDFSKLTPEESMEKMHSITRLAKSC